MKTSRFFAVIAITGIAMVFTSCSETVNNVEDTLTSANIKSAETTPYYGDTCTCQGVLNESEIAGLMEMREEEKLAHDVYIFFYEKYNSVIFSNIAKSELAHTDAVLRLIDGYGLEDPAPDNQGEFANPDFNSLYKSLTEQGSESLFAALKVGAFIEEYDINDLQNLLTETQNQDVVRVYSNLLKGSEHHLQAYSTVLAQLGEVYIPVVIPEEEYNDIITGENTGNRNGNNTSNKSGLQNGKNGSSKGNQNKNSSSSGDGTCNL